MFGSFIFEEKNMNLLVPSSVLLQAGDSKDAQRFVLASSEWLDLQSRVQAVLALPSDIGEYQERYGDSSSGSQMKECFDAMHALQHTAGRYGSPKRLRANILNDPNFLASAARPRNDAFSATVWTLERAHQDAFALASTFRSIPGLARHESPADTTSGIKTLFQGQGQIVDKMQQTVDRLDALVSEFQQIERELDAAQLVMRTFTDRSSKTRTNLDKEIGALQVTIAQLEKARNAAYERWLALTISACVVPAVIGIVGIAAMVILAVPTGGASFAVGSAVTGGAVAVAAAALAAAAGVARTSYDNLVTQVQEEDEFLGKRVCYRSDLGALDQLMKFSLPASGGVIGQLASVRNAWAGSIREISARVNELSVDNLRTGPWLKEAEMTAAAASWSQLDGALNAFVVGSFVDANLIDFGDALPKDEANWQKNFALRRAA
jgi:hypothetical protein